MKKYTFLKLFGLAILIMATLIIISIIEVAIYSYVINPGQDASAAEAHAQVSAPYVSGIFGFIIFFLIARYWVKKGYDNVSRLLFLLPAVYVTLDLAIIIGAGGVKWSDFIWIFLLANSAKFLGCYLGYKMTKISNR